MKIGIVQPYFFPYVGYWQLIHAVDLFVILDDVNYINRGWINRNRILINRQPNYITVPLKKASQNKRICDTYLHTPVDWRDKMSRTIDIAYRKAPFFKEVFPIIDSLIRFNSLSLSNYLRKQILTLSDYLQLKTEFVMTSRCYKNDHLVGKDRILDICKQHEAEVYINPQGGKALYATNVFRLAGIDLRFLAMKEVPYRQRSEEFYPRLSIIDLLMEVGPANIAEHLEAYRLEPGD